MIGTKTRFDDKDRGYKKDFRKFDISNYAHFGIKNAELRVSYVFSKIVTITDLYYSANTPTKVVHARST